MSALDTLYEIVGNRYPIISQIIACLVGAVVFLDSVGTRSGDTTGMNTPEPRTAKSMTHKNMKEGPPSMNQTITNSPGAVQAGRDVTINLQSARRQLTAEQINVITRELQTYGVGSVTVWELGDGEANDLAQQVLAASSECIGQSWIESADSSTAHGLSQTELLIGLRPD